MVRSDKKLVELFDSLLQEMYASATPPLDYLKLKTEVSEKRADCPDRWYEKHTMSGDLYKSMVEKFEKRHKLSATERTKLSWYLLSYSPRETPRVGSYERPPVPSDDDGEKK